MKKQEMNITKAEFIISNTDVSKCPAPNMPEYAFIGRSNVGKSTLINMLTNHKGLAKISRKPGKTQLINHFLINKEWYLVDLPGYGYAKVSKNLRNQFQKIIHSYIKNRENLVNLFVLIDSRHEPQKIDMEFMEFLSTNNIPFAIIFTKSDKLSRRNLEISTEEYKKQMLLEWEEMPPYFISSAVTCKGKDDIISYINDINKTISFSPK